MPLSVTIGSILLAWRAPTHRRTAALVAGAFAFGCGALLSSVDNEPAALVAMTDSVPRCDVEARVLEDAGAFGSLVAVTMLRCPDHHLTGDVGVAIAGEIDDDPGSMIAGEGWLVPLTSERADETAQRMGAVARIRFRELETRAPRGALQRTAANIRASLTEATTRIAARPGGLVRGLAIGDTTAIDPVTVQAFRDSGLAHLLAVSGSNVAIVVGAAALAARNSSLRMRSGIAAGCLLLYVIVVGPEPSVLRAAAMGALALVALVTGRTTEPIAALGVATTIVVGLRPEMVHSAGLHLSVAATAGIVLFGPHLSRRLSMLPRPIAVVLGATLGAQVAVAPILVGTFGELSLVAPLANLIAAPAVPPATIISLGAALLYALSPALGRAAMALAEPFATWILWVADVSAAVPLAAVEVPRILGLGVAIPVGWLAVRSLRGRVG